MRIAGEHGFTASRQQVWAALQDPRMLAGALPGARRLEPTGPDAYALTVDVGVGSVKGTYEGTFALADKEDERACTVRASASGRPGSVEAVARMRLEDGAGGGATLTYDADANVTGPLAGVGQRLVGGAARRTTGQFLSALDRLIATPAGAADGEHAAPGSAAPGERRVRQPERDEVDARADPKVIATAPRAGADPVVMAASALAGFSLALIGVAVGRWSARR